NEPARASLPGPWVSASRERKAGGTIVVRSGDLGQLLGGEVHPARDRREGIVAERDERLGVLRAGGGERVEVAAGDLALELQQLGRALDRGHFLEVGGQR